MTGGLIGLGIPLGDVTALRTSIIEALNLNLEQNDKSNKNLRYLLEEKERNGNSAPATQKKFNSWYYGVWCWGLSQLSVDMIIIYR